MTKIAWGAGRRRSNWEGSGEWETPHAEPQLCSFMIDPFFKRRYFKCDGYTPTIRFLTENVEQTRHLKDVHLYLLLLIYD